VALPFGTPICCYHRLVLDRDLAVGRLRISYQLDTVAGGGTLA